MTVEREVRGEGFSRTVRRGAVRYRLEHNWHILDNGDHFHYIHVYRGVYTRPVKRWAWVVFRADAPERRDGVTWRWA